MPTSPSSSSSSSLHTHLRSLRFYLTFEIEQRFIVVSTLGLPPDNFQSGFYEEIDYWGPFDNYSDANSYAIWFFRKLLIGSDDYEYGSNENLSWFSKSLKDGKEFRVETAILRKPSRHYRQHDYE